jgi:regulator of RNase E activity RraA
MMREHLYSAVISDALDGLGFKNQSPRLQFTPYTGTDLLVGRCKTTLWVDMAHVDPRPYELELQAVDACKPDDVLIAAAGSSIRSGIWGELLTTAARNRGCVGAVVDGAIRDVAKIRAMKFPVYARATCVYDSLNRQRVVDVDTHCGN